MKCNAVILASFALGQSVMATNIYRPGGHFHVRAYNGSEPSFPSGTGPSSGFARPTGKPHHVTSKKPCKTKASSATASSKASAVTSVPAVSSDPVSPSTALYTTTYTDHESQTVVVTVTPSATSAPSATTSPVVPTTLKSYNVDTSSVAPATSSKAPASSLPPYPTTFATSASSTVASTGAASGTGSAAYPSGTTVAAYYQCGGINWTGPTTCVEGTHCQYQNPFYYQCIYQS
ncbi:hypothetical protein MFRU_043g00260 [Monilinia fructicola]|uniref:CBM1 domain-containing protein n=1 Tax=Monilinia fructicola TaxID=38448 RepID=A0A5M9J911_MONFR|nr:hypothetical protein EYC84_011276 [Monilinia fructicola]KAG4026222.1 hypothetical protein MFRU_043g00260 [Monilinia fructicola]